MTSISSIPSVSVRDEVDLLALLQVIWRKKAQIATIVAASGLVAAAYAFLVTPEYEVSTLLRTAAINDLDALNRTNIYTLPPEQALNRLGASLDSYDTRLGYFRTNEELQAAYLESGRTQEQAFEDFNRNALKVVQPDPKKTNLLAKFIGVDMRYPAGVDGKAVLNGLVQYAVQKEREQISQDLKVIIDNRVKEVDGQLAVVRVDYEANKQSRIAVLREDDVLKRAQLNDELRALRVQLKQRRDDRIALLNEAISIARTLGLKKPSTPSSMGMSEADSGGNVIRTEINNQQIPLYFMGTDALEAEKQALRNRSSDDFVSPRVSEIRKELLMLEQNRKIQALEQRKNDELFLKNIEGLRAERGRLLSIDTDMSDLRLVVVDRAAVEPLRAVFPKKSLIIAMGLAIGVLIGMVFVLIRHAMRMRMRENEALRGEILPVAQILPAEVLPSAKV
ncbi:MULTISPECIES: Wzz/FepE/Etk N-terminal domain-containing protein [unclassified Pseudomonas]|uniref:Wzz/FepE/Etk N-terminal domain-containing protein n=1 Tax=unclassified Pseudomonas TaxID=196821 RepID=UPI000A1D982A|nr:MULTISPECIES: Wzz/FepE/Etk N-terminal domain-containing protein [unclassified Pseudomonas]